MEMTDDNADLFCHSLVKMMVIFCDQMDHDRVAMYWQTLGPLLELDEWVYACRQAMLRETFYKVPLPGQLMDYVRELRQQRHEDARASVQRQRLLAEPPMSPEELQAQMRALYEQLDKPGKAL
jgi:hypothetical protein